MCAMAKTLAIIGGSGLYELEDLTDVEPVQLTTPFGAPSDRIVRGRIGDVTLLFLPRHGRGHRIPPHRINYRANVFALKALGADQLVSVSAVGSLREEIHPGDMVLVDQFIDRTRQRASTFFDDCGVVAHVGFAEPTDAALSEALRVSVLEVGGRVHVGGTYVCMEGPQFSTRAESLMYRGLGAHVIGMTNLPEAKLAREAELPYASLAMATDYDCWHQSAATVSVEAVLAVMTKNVGLAKSTLRALVTRLPDAAQSPAARALEHAILTSPAFIAEETRELLSPLIGKYLPTE
jgi:5'-methylthioadenosine phosphorylase